MNGFALNVQELSNGNDEPQVTFILTRGGDEVLRRDARVFSEDDMIAASNELTVAGALPQADMDQAIAEAIEPVRIKWLRSREGVPGEEAAVVARYAAVLPGADGGEPGIRDVARNRVLTNFVLTLDEDLEVQDDIEAGREFAGRLTSASGTSPFRVAAKDFADNGKLRAALFAAGGCELVIHCDMEELRRAVSTLSSGAGAVRRRKLTTNFGWTADGKEYLTPGLRISQVEQALLLRTVDAVIRIVEVRNQHPGKTCQQLLQELARARVLVEIPDGIVRGEHPHIALGFPERDIALVNAQDRTLQDVVLQLFVERVVPWDQLLLEGVRLPPFAREPDGEQFLD
jgi:hypothetical protein